MSSVGYYPRSRTYLDCGLSPWLCLWEIAFAAHYYEKKERGFLWFSDQVKDDLQQLWTGSMESPGWQLLSWCNYYLSSVFLNCPSLDCKSLDDPGQGRRMGCSQASLPEATRPPLLTAALCPWLPSSHSSSPDAQEVLSSCAWSDQGGASPGQTTRPSY